MALYDSSPTTTAQTHFNVGDLTTSKEPCVDSGEVTCETAQVYFNVCSDIQHAKVVCRRSCNLCGLVDGHWSDWSPWSKCDVTCGSGNRIRSRTCTNPAPANQGLNCTGPVNEHKTCTFDPCQVHGGWSGWSSWAGCSVSCGVGIQRRDRTCTNPSPQYFGDHCFGDSHEDQICYPSNCTVHAGWSSWNPWSACSATRCVGFKRRDRTCTNPPPQYFGDYCFGDVHEDKLCYPGHCGIDGGWSAWSSWGTCSPVCRKRAQICPCRRNRYRDCNNPSRYLLGTDCKGSTSDFVNCGAYTTNGRCE